MELSKITLHEVGNDGRTIYLYYDDLAGLYLAFGLSAYYTTMVTEPYMSYSEQLQMPVALLRRTHVLALRQGLVKKEHEVKKFYRFEMRQPIGEEGYDRWAQKIREAHNSIYRK